VIALGYVIEHAQWRLQTVGSRVDGRASIVWPNGPIEYENTQWNGYCAEYDVICAPDRRRRRGSISLSRWIWKESVTEQNPRILIRDNGGST
jgi:hypothetical protein